MVELLVRESDDVLVDTVACDWLEVTVVPLESVPVAVAVLVTEPAVTSAAVVMYVPVQVSEAPAASEDWGRSGWPGPPCCRRRRSC